MLVYKILYIRPLSQSIGYLSSPLTFAILAITLQIILEDLDKKSVVLTIQFLNIDI